MIKLWKILCIVSFLVGIAIYFDLGLRLHDAWSWQQFLHHESFIAIAGCIGVVLLIVALLENRKIK